MLWTLAVIADSGRAMYEALVAPLEEGEREALWRDYVRFGELFGLSSREVPGSYREFREWWEWKLSSPELHATEHALEMAPLVAFRQPVPLAARGNLAVQNHIVKGTLPPRVRQIFGIRWSAAHEASFRSIAAAHRRAHRLFPGGCAAGVTTSSSTWSAAPSGGAAGRRFPSSGRSLDLLRGEAGLRPRMEPPRRRSSVGRALHS